jgi:tetratricopeptide (TPR) repeat protein
MARMLRRSHGQFALAFARCNSPVQRASLVATLRDSLAALDIHIAEVTLSGPDADIPAELAAAGTPSTNAGTPLFVYGLESLMPSDPLSDKPSEAQYRALAQLNERRGRYQTLARPLVFWVPEYALRLVAEVAGDFWGWRSGVFEFATEPEVLRGTYERELTLPFMEMTNLTRAEKEARIRVLNALLDDYEGDDSETRAARSNVFYRLGQMHKELGQYSQAESLYRASLKTYEELGDKRSVAMTLHSLALLRVQQERLAGAHELLSRSRDLLREIGLEKDAARVEETLRKIQSLLSEAKVS